MRKIIIIALCLTLTLANGQDQDVAIGRIVTDITTYTRPLKHTDTIKIEIVYFKDSVLVCMKPEGAKIMHQWIYPVKKYINEFALPTRFYTNTNKPVKIVEGKKGYLIIATVKFRSVNRMIYKVEPVEKWNGKRGYQVTRYEENSKN